MVIASVRYEFRITDERLRKAIYNALVPEVLNPPSGCKAMIDEKGEVLVLNFSCSKVSDARALNNGLLSILSMLLKASKVVDK